MAFVFPDPNTTPEFTAANGVVYAYDNTDGKWVVKSSPFQGDYVKKTGGDMMQGPLSVMGDRSPNDDGIESTIKAYNVDSGRNGDLQLKRNGDTKIWCSTNGITVQGALKMNVEGSKLKSSTNTDLFSFNKNGVFYEGAYTAEGHIATKQNVDSVASEVNQLTEFVKNRVLKYTFDNNTGQQVTAPGRIGSNSGFWSSVATFSFGTADANGITTPRMFNGLTIETYSPEEDKSNYYKITNATGAPTSVGVQYISGDLFYVPDMELDVYIYNDVNDNESDVNLGSVSSISFVTDGVIKHNYDTRITFQSATTATTGSGLVQFERPGTSGRRGLTIRGKNTDNNDDDLLYTYTFAAGGDAVGYTGRIVNDNHITNKKYVDDKVQSVSATTIWYPLTYTRSTSGVSLGYFYWLSNQLIYKKTIADQIIPKLKVGDECRILKLDGSVIILRVNQIDADVNSNYSFTVLNTTPTVTIDAGDVNTMFEVSFNFF